MTQNIQHKYMLIPYQLQVSFLNNIEKNRNLLQIVKYRGCTKRLRNKFCLISNMHIYFIDMNDNGCNINILQICIKNKTLKTIDKLYENKYNEINKEIKTIFRLSGSVQTTISTNHIDHSQLSPSNIETVHNIENNLESNEISNAQSGDLEMSPSKSIELHRFRSTPL